MDKFGRKRSLLCSSIPLFLGWILILFAKEVWHIYLARCLGGLGTAFGNIAVSVYIGEIADKEIRGKLCTTYSLLKLIGYLFVYGAGPFVSYTTLIVICSILPLVFFAIFSLMPETPYYLIKVGRLDEAKKNLLKLQSVNTTKDALEKQFLQIQECVDYDMRNKSSIFDLFKENYRRSLFIMLGIKALQQFSGITAIDSYMQTIIGESKSGLSPQVSSLIYGVIQIPGVLLSAALVDRLGRKPILIISSLGCAIAMISEGIYFYLQSTDADVSSITWLPTTGIILFALMNNFGVCTLPYVYLGELFATNVKEQASSLSIFCSYIMSFTISKTFKPLSNLWGMYTMFWIFGISCIIGSLYVHFIVPETKGKTFFDIQEKINRKRQKNNTAESA